MKCGAPQRSRVGPLVWNVMYDDFLRLDLPAGTSIIGFADDALVVCAAENVRILELRINESLWWAKRWLNSRGLKIVPEKTEALIIMDRRSFSENMRSSGKQVSSILPTGNYSREGGHPQGWKAQTRREMRDEMVWWTDQEMDIPPDPGARHLAE